MVGGRIAFERGPYREFPKERFHVFIGERVYPLLSWRQ
jgi:hypothetical protein